ncbi:MAG: hypothetical protein KDI01_03045 [Halioglobus sp.]|nr:hypothetical protein [Halioglobus sp.]
MPRPRHRFALALCLAGSGALLSACTQWHYQLGSALPAAAAIPDARQPLALAQVLADLGPPLRLSATATGYVLAWEHWHIRERTLGLSLGAMGADFLSLDWGDARIRGEFLLLSFDRQHRLTGRALSHWDNRGGGGRSIQPFISLVSLVDVDDMTQRLPQHNWGANALLPLPATLNLHSRPDTGRSGIEQRGTPASIGQRSLEMQ